MNLLNFIIKKYKRTLKRPRVNNVDMNHFDNYYWTVKHNYYAAFCPLTKMY